MELSQKPTGASKNTGLYIFEIVMLHQNCDQNVCPMRGAYYANKNAPAYMEKFFKGKKIPYGEKFLKAPPPPLKGPTTRWSENFAQNLGP